MKQKYLIICSINFLLSLLSLIRLEYGIIFFLIGCLFLLKYKLYDIEELNERCNPKTYINLHKDNPKYYLNCAYAYIYLNDIENANLYLEKAKQDSKHISNLKQLKIDECELFLRKTNGEDITALKEEMELRWKSSFFTFYELKRKSEISSNHYKKRTQLEIVSQLYEVGRVWEVNDLEKCKEYYSYVYQYGGETYYKQLVEKWFLDNNIEPIYVKKKHCDLIQKYKFYKNDIQNYFVISFFIYLIIIFLIGGFVK